MFTIITQNKAASDTSKQIAFGNSTLLNSVMYTVPEKRKFIGYLGNTQNGPQTFINAAGIYCYHGSGTTVAGSGGLVQHTLIAGTVVKEGGTSNSSFIYGVEYDA